MAETLDGSPVPPGRRGQLVIKDQVVQTIAETAALEVASVLKISSHLNPLSRSLPSAAATLTPSHARVTVRLATTFDRPLFDVATEVRAHVAETVTRLTAMSVDVVDVEITSVEAGHPDTTTTPPVRRPLT